MESQTSAVLSPAGSPPEFPAVSERASPPEARRRTGKAQAAVAPERPATNAHEPRKAARSFPRERAVNEAARPASAAAPRSHATGRPRRASKKRGLTRSVAAVTNGQRTATAARRRRPAVRLRACTSPPVFQARNVPPCPARTARAKRPTRTVYQSRIPTGSRAEKSVKRVSVNQPSGPSGTPRRRFPSAAPRTTGRSALAAQKTASHEPRQSRSVTWLRNSIEIPRRIRHQRTRKMAR